MAKTPQNTSNGQVDNLSPQETKTQQRDDKGRFVRGNTSGAGNPFARRVAWLRAELVDCLTREDVRKIAGTLILKAQGGDVPSTKILFSYVFGKPGTWQDPDKLDLEECNLFVEESKMSGEMHQVAGQAGPAFALGVMRNLRPMMSKKYLQLLGEVCALEPDQAEEKIHNLMFADVIDECGDDEDSAPDANGEIDEHNRKKGGKRGNGATESRQPSLRNRKKKKGAKHGRRAKAPSTADVTVANLCQTSKNSDNGNGHLKPNDIAETIIWPLLAENPDWASDLLNRFRMNLSDGG